MIVANAAEADDVRTAQTVRTYNLSLPLIFQGAYLGDVPVAASPDGNISVNVDRFINLLGERLAPETIAQLKAAAGGQQVAGITAFSPAGVTVTYDTAKLELRVSIPVSKQGGQSISAMDATEPGLNSKDMLKPERFSGTLLLNARQSYVWSPEASQGWDPFRVSGDLSLNMFGNSGIYLFAQGEYDEAAADPFHRGNAVLMHDDVENVLRTSVGDVTPVPAGFQSSPILGGLSIQRQFGELQPFRNVRPSGLFRFSLDRSSTVDVVINGATIRTLRLDAGQYDLKDFPLFNGLNDVELYIVDEYGRHLVAAFSQFFSSQLLAKGVAEFGATVGVPQLRGTADDITYDDNKPAVSTYLRYGLSSDVTVGTNVQGDELQWLAGGELAWASPIGNIGVVAAWSDIRSLGEGSSYLASYDVSAEELWFIKSPQINLSYQRTSQLFASLGTLTPNETRATEMRGRMSFQMPLNFGGGLSASYTQGRDSEPDETRYGLSLSQHLGFLDVMASGERVEKAGLADDNRLLVSLSIPLSGRENVRSTYDTRNDQVQIEYSRYQRDEVDDYGLRFAATRDQDRGTGSGEFAYNANRFGLTLQHDAIADAEMNLIQSQRSSYMLSTQLAFAGDSVAWGRPVGQRFAIIAAHETLDGSDVGVSQSKDSRRLQAETGLFGPALVSAGNAYQPQSIYLDVENLPSGYDAGTGQFDLMPGAASGYALTVGSDASHVVVGTVMGLDGKPLALLGGELRSRDRADATPVLVFTNKAGRFFAEGLAPGKYMMALGPSLEFVVPIEVPAGSAGTIDVGNVVAGNKGT
ncbi:MAG: fimbria/pilus outer membrane usher protein [Micropepsaceae bacterium]